MSVRGGAKRREGGISLSYRETIGSSLRSSPPPHLSPRHPVHPNGDILGVHAGAYVLNEPPGLPAERNDGREEREVNLERSRELGVAGCVDRSKVT